jgi:hypothetical protein
MNIHFQDIPLSRMISPALYWVMTADDFTLDINNPEEPKVLVVGNNPDRLGHLGGLGRGPATSGTGRAAVR